MSLFDPLTLLLEREWDYGYVGLVEETWPAGTRKRVCDVKTDLGLLTNIVLVTDSPKWRIRVELQSRKKVIPIDESIEDMINKGEVRPVCGLMLWASANSGVGIYTAMMSLPYPGFPFRRLTITLSNESGASSKIIAFQAIWIEVYR